MRTRIASVLAAGPVVLSLVSAAPVPPDPQRDAKQVEQAYRDYLAAIERRDEKALRRLMSDGYARTSGSGGLLGLVDRDKEIKLLLAPVDYWKAEVKEVEARVHGGAAVVYAVYRIKTDQVGGGVPIDVLMHDTATFARKDGAWVLVADHPTAIPEQ